MESCIVLLKKEHDIVNFWDFAAIPANVSKTMHQMLFVISYVLYDSTHYHTV